MRKLKPYIVGAGLGAFALAFVPLSGLIPSSAEPPQATVLDWYFNMAASQAITLRSLATEVPPLEEVARLDRGGGHYELVCADCHGSPLAPPEQFAENLSPAPPLLMERMEQWHPDARIFATVKHGIRRTAMPGWPTQMRDDEVWDMVAFIKAMPDMDETRYLEVAGDPSQGSCVQCHAEDGSGRSEAFPRLDLQSPEYLLASLKAFRDGTRLSGTMMAAAASLTDTQLEAMAEQFGRAVAVEPAPATEHPGAVIAQKGILDRDIAACDSCHGADARTDFPRLAGQNRNYLVTQLELFSEHGAERGGPYAEIMAQAIEGLGEKGGLSEAEINAVADWYAR